MLSVEGQQKVEELLVSGKILDQKKLDSIRAAAAKESVPLLTYIAKNNLVSEEDMAKVLADATGVLYINLTQITLPADMTGMLSREVAENYMTVPVGMQGKNLVVGMLDPTNLQAVDYLSHKIDKPLLVYMASQGSIQRILSQLHSESSADINALTGGTSTKAEEAAAAAAAAQAAPGKNLQTLIQDAPVTKVLNSILDNAAQSRASDIHIEPRERDLKIRYRVDGILREVMTLPKTAEPALVSRIKILSNLRIDEHRVPQDGQFQMKSSGRAIDLRIAISPVVWGEQVVIRLLDKDDKLLTLDALEFRGRAYRLIKEGVHRPHGMTLATGPTGSGKSTTLYAIVQELKSVAINIVTLEDPVEYKMDSINQIQVNTDVGLTFSSGLRSILRQDPNVVLVGEIRDKETADLAVQAALTGHVVLSTLHTNSASGVLPRLLDMDIEPYLIASTVNTVIGQRLVRRLCQNCRQEVPSNEAETKSIQLTLKDLLPKTQSQVTAASADLGYEIMPLVDAASYTIWKAVGCSECTNGFKGRLGVHEVFAMTPPMEKLLATRATSSEVQKQAQADGMVTMKQDGYLKALNGITTLEEVARVASDA